MPVSSEWKPVKLRLGWTNGFEPGDCMLVEQFRVQVLKYFDLRNLTSDLPCSIRLHRQAGFESRLRGADRAADGRSRESPGQEGAGEARRHDEVRPELVLADFCVAPAADADRLRNPARA